MTKLRPGDGSCGGMVNPAYGSACTFKVGAFPEGVAFDGVNIWVANSGSGSVSRR